MPVELGIYSNLLRQPRSVAELNAESAAAEHNALSAQTDRLGYQNALQAQQDAGAERDAYKQFGSDREANASVLLRLGLGKQAFAYQKSGLDALKTQGEIALSGAHAGNFKSETATRDFNLADAKRTKAMQDIAALRSPDEARAGVAKHLALGDIDQVKADAILASLPTDPAGFPQWKARTLIGIMAPKDQIAAQHQDATLAETVRGHDLTAGTALQGQSVTMRGQDIGARTALGGQAMTQRGQDLTSKTQLTLGGMNPDGTPSAGIESTAQLIAAGRADPIVGYALTKPAGMATMQRVAEINPAYDATEYAAKKAAAKAFTTGKEGALLRSIGTATKHLDMLDGLTDALKNGNVQLFNKIGNEYARQTGQPAPTNFDAAKEIVAQEVVKSIVMNGGSMQERMAAAQEIKAANSPKQLHGVVQTYKTIMAAQHESLLQQRDAAGLPRSTLADYGEGVVSPRAGGAAPAAAPGAGKLTAAEQAELAQLRQRFGKR